MINMSMSHVFVLERPHQWRIFNLIELSQFFNSAQPLAEILLSLKRRKVVFMIGPNDSWQNLNRKEPNKAFELTSRILLYSRVLALGRQNRSLPA